MPTNSFASSLCRLHLAVAVLGCALSAAPAAAQQSALVVGVDVGANPYVIGQLDGSVTGFNVDLIEAVAERLGRPGVQFVDQQFSGIFAGLDAERYDFIAAPVTMTAERAEAMLFMESFIGTAYQFLLDANDPDIHSLDSLSGKTVAVNNGSAYDVWLTENQASYDFTIERYGKNADAFQAVLAGRADVAMSGDGNVMYASTQNPQLKPGPKIETGALFSWAFRKGDSDLRAEIERAVECLKLDGTVAAIYRDWFGMDPAPGSPPVTVDAGLGQPGFAGYEATFTTESCAG
jgi:polar amino acid transport system substrate-binding protein